MDGLLIVVILILPTLCSSPLLRGTKSMAIPERWLTDSRSTYILYVPNMKGKIQNTCYINIKDQTGIIGSLIAEVAEVNS